MNLLNILEIPNITIQINGVDLTFKVKTPIDLGAQPPEKQSDSHGVVHYMDRSLDIGDDILLWLADHYGIAYYYDVAKSMEIAKRDGWDLKDGLSLAEIIQQDFEYLRGWYQGEWCYIKLDVILLNPDGSESEVRVSVSGVESRDKSHVEHEAYLLAKDMAEGLYTRFHVGVRPYYYLD